MDRVVDEAASKRMVDIATAKARRLYPGRGISSVKISFPDVRYPAATVIFRGDRQMVMFTVYDGGGPEGASAEASESQRRMS